MCFCDWVLSQSPHWSLGSEAHMYGCLTRIQHAGCFRATFGHADQLHRRRPLMASWQDEWEHCCLICRPACEELQGSRFALLEAWFKNALLVDPFLPGGRKFRVNLKTAVTVSQPNHPFTPRSGLPQSKSFFLFLLAKVLQCIVNSVLYRVLYAGRRNRT